MRKLVALVIVAALTPLAVPRRRRSAGGLRRARRDTARGVGRAGHRDRDRRTRQDHACAGLGRSQAGRSREGGRAYDLPHRLDRQGLHRGGIGHARGQRQAQLGRQGDRSHALVPHVRSVGHRGNDRARPARPPQRSWARRGRPALCAAVQSDTPADRGAAALHPAGNQLSIRVRLRQHPLRRGRPAHRGSEREELGTLRAGRCAPRGRHERFDVRLRFPVRRRQPGVSRTPARPGRSAATGRTRSSTSTTNSAATPCLPAASR